MLLPITRHKFDDEWYFKKAPDHFKDMFSLARIAFIKKEIDLEGQHKKARLLYRNFIGTANENTLEKKLISIETEQENLTKEYIRFIEYFKTVK